jgi:hypothetical protein
MPSFFQFGSKEGAVLPTTQREGERDKEREGEEALLSGWFQSAEENPKENCLPPLSRTQRLGAFTFCIAAAALCLGLVGPTVERPVWRARMEESENGRGRGEERKETLISLYHSITLLLTTPSPPTYPLSLSLPLGIHPTARRVP